MTQAMQKMSMGRENPLATADLTRRPAGQAQDLSGQNHLIHRNGACGTLLRAVVTVAFVMLLGCGSGGVDQSSLALGGGGAPAPLSDWMAPIADATPISLLGIPGTHDTGTYGQGALAWGGWVKTQDKSIVDQLDHGIRFLDIRGRHIGDTLEIHHAQIDLGLNFQDVIDACKQFLQAHPTETILLNLGHEYEDSNPTSSYQQAFLNYYNNNRYLDNNHTRELWYLGTTIPTLGQVRGKIVLMRSFDLDPPPAVALGIDVPGGQNSAYYSHQFSTNPQQTLYIENLWQPDNWDGRYTDKENAVISNVERKQGDRSPDHLYMTFTSGTYPPQFPSYWLYATAANYADNINPWFLTYIHAERGPMGIVIMDFPGDDIIQLVINSNAH